MIHILPKTVRVAAFLTSRSLVRGNKGVIIMPIIMMALIYINVLFIPSLIKGALNQIDDRVVDVYSSNIVVTPPASDTAFANAKDALDKLRALPEVEAAAAMYQTTGHINVGEKSGAWQVSAIDPDSYAKVFKNNAILGGLLLPGDTTGILLGSRIAGNGLEGTPSYKLSLQSVTLRDNAVLTLQNSPSMPFQIKGVFDNKFLPADQRAFITYDAFNKIFPPLVGQATIIHLKTKPGTNFDQLEKKVLALLPKVSLQRSGDFAVGIHEQALTIKKINSILSAFSFIVAAITIFIITYVDLVNRRKQIGIQRAIGISNSAIVITYLMRAVIDTIIGMIIGGLLYLFVMVPYYKTHPFLFPEGPVSLVVQQSTMIRYAFALAIIAVTGALVPAWRAVKIKILDAIWS